MHRRDTSAVRLTNNKVCSNIDTFTVEKERCKAERGEGGKTGEEEGKRITKVESVTMQYSTL